MATSKLADNCQAQEARDWQLIAGSRRLHFGDPSIGFGESADFLDG